MDRKAHYEATRPPISFLNTVKVFRGLFAGSMRETKGPSAAKVRLGGLSEKTSLETLLVFRQFLREQVALNRPRLRHRCLTATPFFRITRRSSFKSSRTYAP